MSIRKKSVIRGGVGVLGAAAVAGAAWIALPAEAATTGVVSVVSGNIVTYTAAADKANNVVVTRSGNTVTVDDIFGLKAGAGCSAVSGDVTKIRCALSVAPVWVRVDVGNGSDTVVNNSGLGMTARLGSGNDKFTGGPLRDDVYGNTGNDNISGLGGDDVLRGESDNDVVSGGDGNDVLSGSTGNDTLLGGNGDETMYGGPGNDRLEGGAGEDELQGNQGNDIMYGDADDDVFVEDATDYPAGTDSDSFIGGDGDDAVFYWNRTKAITADNDAVVGDDGAAGERDSIYQSVESIWGGYGNDRITGSDRAAEELLTGGPGNDILRAGAGDDAVWGDGGIDNIDAGAGYDFCADAVEAGETVVGCEYGDGAPPVTASQRRNTPDNGNVRESLPKNPVEAMKALKRLSSKTK
ncbi:hypothetical protein KOI35_07430 [Actinoplanes bogorensis]|uniref:Calcium-binding protein n=1 Tax=Paractinoplanes bogorensis TaxID=1610840 RepID=A0ABS5YIN6_9ACTN|nr:calcium-binding protein [Actinoplanes bogorensis]MBU2663339.1 hypothetical protein [Actinoplanes bogorensis]